MLVLVLVLVLVIVLVLVFSIVKKKKKKSWKAGRRRKLQKKMIPERGHQTGIRKGDFVSREARRKF